MDNEHWIELETTIALQDDCIRKLREQVDAQERMLYKLAKEVEEVKARLEEDEGPRTLSAAEEPPPPHY